MKWVGYEEKTWERAHTLLQDIPDEVRSFIEEWIAQGGKKKKLAKSLAMHLGLVDLLQGVESRPMARRMEDVEDEGMEEGEDDVPPLLVPTGSLVPTGRPGGRSRVARSVPPPPPMGKWLRNPQTGKWVMVMTRNVDEEEFIDDEDDV